MPAKRTKQRQNWPIGLYAGKAKGVVYYRWLDPRSKKYVGLGRDLENAKKAAALKNQEIAADPVKRLLDRIDGKSPSTTFETAVKTWLAAVRSRKRGRGDDVQGVSEKTLQDYDGFGRRFRKHFGDETGIASIDLAAVAKYLDDTYAGKPRAYNYARGLLVQIWTVAISKGWVTVNVPDQTMKAVHAVKRQRLTLDQFEAIVAAAQKSEEDAWFAPAARFALYCDQRRGDVAGVPESAWDGSTLVFEQEKTGAVVRVKAGERLRAAIKDCLAVAKVGEGIIRKPGRREAVSADMLTKTFSKLRDELIVKRHKAWRRFKKTSDSKPTWHEIRSLGAKLAKDAGLAAGALAGHATAQMEAMYQKGHARTFEADSL